MYPLCKQTSVKPFLTIDPSSKGLVCLIFFYIPPVGVQDFLTLARWKRCWSPSKVTGQCHRCHDVKSCIPGHHWGRIINKAAIWRYLYVPICNMLYLYVLVVVVCVVFLEFFCWPFWWRNIHLPHEKACFGMIGDWTNRFFVSLIWSQVRSSHRRIRRKPYHLYLDHVWILKTGCDYSAIPRT